MKNQSSVDNVMNENATISDDEIDLAELFVSLASSWRLIASAALVSVALSYGYGVTQRIRHTRPRRCLHSRERAATLA
jgi:uncharacterized protein involved in exopolysaccharide biosynthesis